MSLSLTPFSNGDVVNAGAVRAQMDTVENFVNTGISASDLQSSPAFVQTSHIFKPDFYGAPAPRSRHETAETHFRSGGYDRVDRVNFHPELSLNRWLPIRDMYVTVKVPRTCRFTVRAHCFVYEAGGFGEEVDVEQEPGNAIAMLGCFVGGTKAIGTDRFVYVGQLGGNHDLYDWTHKNHSWAFQHNTELSVGIINIGFRLKILPRAAIGGALGSKAKHIIVQERSLVLDMFLR